jgi:Rrf2 family protein
MLSQASGYATMALGYVASAGGKPVLVRKIAEACEIPAPYLSKIINNLARAGLVTTQRGIGGGVTLSREATTISLFDLCAALDDPILDQRCMLGVAQCSDARACPAHEFSVSLRARQLAFLQSKTVADIAAFENERRWRTPNPDAVEFRQQAQVNGTATNDASGKPTHGGAAKA